ncbi:MAG: hypothetical protein Q4P33_02100 [Flaviflexus sp.]|nr:hypothetical protein [Flaviflexus sp.]
MWIALLILAALAVYLAANVARYILSGEALPWWHPRSVLFTQILFFAAIILAGIYVPSSFGTKVFALLGLALIGGVAVFVFLKKWGTGPVGPCECCAHGHAEQGSGQTADTGRTGHGADSDDAPVAEEPSDPLP